MGARRAYRVEFTRAGEPRTGTVVARTAEQARTEASRIGNDGGAATVVYVHDDGRRDILVRYGPAAT